MKIKILKINTFLPDITGTSKKGFPYVIKHWMCDIEVNGEKKSSIEVKYMGKNFDLELKEYEVNESIYNGIASYQIQKQQQEKKWGYNKPNYTKREYNDLFKMALTKLKINLDKISEDNKIKLCISYFIGAKDLGVKTDIIKEDNQAKDLQKAEYQQNSTEKFLKEKNPEEDLSVDWEKDEEEIPF